MEPSEVSFDKAMMKIAWFFLLVTATSALSISSPQVPNFRWTDNHDRSEGSPRNSLEVHFHDGGNDVIRFHKIQVLSAEDEDPSCVMFGSFMEDPSVKVTLTGGCHQSQDFEITIVGSDRLGHPTFEVIDGKAKATGLPLNRGRFLPNPVLKAPIIDRSEELVEPPKKGKIPMIAWLSLGMHVDDAFVANYGSEEKARHAMFKIAGHAQAWLSHDSLGTEIILECKTPEEWTVKRRLYGDYNTLDWLTTLKRTPFNETDLVHSELYIGIATPFAESSGISYTGSACANETLKVKALTIVHWRLYATSGKNLAHEVGHTLGLTHDFHSWKLDLRYDKDGYLCTFRQGIMDYGETSYSQWSRCSKQDLAGLFEKGDLNCLRAIYRD